jgi:propanol-preferring alcohol dehydrogenase
VGTRLDLEEALTFAAEGKVKATIETLPLESVNDVFDRLRTGKVNGRVVLGIGEEQASGRNGKKQTTAA